MHPTPLVAWESFYVIVGSSAGALTGLQFVVMALISERGMQGSGRQISAFGTPTVVHFCSVLLLSAILSSPWHGLSGAAIALGAVGLAGVVYGCLTIKRALRQDDYKPVAEDWMWHTALPCVAYAAVLVASFLLKHDATAGLFTIGAASLLLLFIGIHNAWDTVTYIVTKPLERKEP